MVFYSVTKRNPTPPATVHSERLRWVLQGAAVKAWMPDSSVLLLVEQQSSLGFAIYCAPLYQSQIQVDSTQLKRNVASFKTSGSCSSFLQRRGS
jgi:hypothetical protein